MFPFERAHAEIEKLKNDIGNLLYILSESYTMLLADITACHALAASKKLMKRGNVT